MAKRPSTTSSAVAVLKKARTYLSKPGHWIQGSYSDGKKVCAVGAVNKFCEAEDYFTVRRTALKLLHAELPAGSLSVEHFNDIKTRKKAEVLQLFDAAIKSASRRLHGKKKGHK